MTVLRKTMLLEIPSLKRAALRWNTVVACRGRNLLSSSSHHHHTHNHHNHHHHHTGQDTADPLTDKCHTHVLSSPYDPIPEGPYPPLADFILSSWKNNAAVNDNKVAIVDTSTQTKRTFGEYARTAGGLAAHLKYEMNIGQDDTVAFYCPNNVDYAPVALGVSLTGAVLTPINPLYTENELVHALITSRSSAIFVHETALEVALSALTRNQQLKNNIRHVIVLKKDPNAPAVPEGTIDLESLRHHDKAFWETVPRNVASSTSDRVCLLPFSSGTTGTPKGVCLTHENIVANLWQIDVIEGPTIHPDSTVVASPLPFFHIYAFTVNLMYGAWKGTTLVTQSGRFDLAHYLQMLQDYKVNRTYVVPPILLGLTKHPMVDQYDLSSLETILSAAAPAGAKLEEAAAQRVRCTVKQCWGMSELSPLGAGHTDANVKHGSVGPLAASTRGKIVDEQGKTLGPHESGELLIQGPQVMKGYLDEPESTAVTLSSQTKWLRTGDVAHYDEDGYFYITDRIKELIKVRGFPVAPAELEALLVSHDAIADAAVISTPDEQSGELPLAFVVLKPNTTNEITAQAIQEWVKERVAPHKRLDGGIVFTDQIPKSASGKILRRLLKQQQQ